MYRAPTKTRESTGRNGCATAVPRSLGEEEVLGEGPLEVEPLGFAAEAGALDVVEWLTAWRIGRRIARRMGGCCAPTAGCYAAGFRPSWFACEHFAKQHAGAPGEREVWVIPSIEARMLVAMIPRLRSLRGSGQAG